MPARLVFTLLGTGSSGGVPRIGNDWGACDPNEPRNRRTRCSALAELYTQGSMPTRVLIDTSPDMREQLLSASVDRLDGVVFTHDHADQTHGLDDLRVVAMLQRAQVKTYMDEATARTLIPKFRYCFEGSKGYPAILANQTRLEAFKPLKIDGKGGAIELLPLLQEHGPIPSLGFRIGDLAYCNDVNRLPDQTKQALRDLDVLIIDALRFTPHPTHANLETALGWISELAPRRAVLTNMHIDLDYQTLVGMLPDGVEPGYDGMQIVSVDV